MKLIQNDWMCLNSIWFKPILNVDMFMTSIRLDVVDTFFKIFVKENTRIYVNS